MLGLLLPAFSYTGMDGPAHMSEETAGASKGPPRAIMAGVGIMFSGGLAMILSMLFSMTVRAADLGWIHGLICLCWMFLNPVKFLRVWVT